MQLGTVEYLNLDNLIAITVVEVDGNLVGLAEFSTCICCQLPFPWQNCSRMSQWGILS